MTLTIHRLPAEQLEQAQSVITSVCLEFFGEPPKDFGDMVDLSLYYSPPSGIFLALMDGNKMVGTGALRRMDDEICELKRMWFLPEARGKGYGTKMAEQLLAFGRSAGYKQVRLDTAAALQGAIRLYRRLGFRDIERYNDGPCAVFMEKEL